MSSNSTNHIEGLNYTKEMLINRIRSYGYTIMHNMNGTIYLSGLGHPEVLRWYLKHNKIALKLWDLREHEYDEPDRI